MWIGFIRLGLVLSGGFCEKKGAGNFLSRWVSIDLHIWLHDFVTVPDFRRICVITMNTGVPSTAVVFYNSISDRDQIQNNSRTERIS
jgi:hypothetical protein